MVGTSSTSAAGNSALSSQTSSSDSGPKFDQSAPAKDDVKRFNDSLERREGDHQQKDDQQSGNKDSDKNNSGSRQDDRNPERQGEAQSPMQLFGKMNANQSQSIQPASSMAGDNRLNELAQNLTSRILVGETNGTAEVRIQLNDAVLPGTEVRISERDGRLVAEFMVSNADSANFLNQRQDDLAARLSKVLQKDVDVITIQDSGTGTNDGDTNRRSSQEYHSEDDNDREEDLL